MKYYWTVLLIFGIARFIVSKFKDNFYEIINFSTSEKSFKIFKKLNPEVF
jgi:hypothetical protein